MLYTAQVQRDYEELPANAVPQLRDSLLQLLLRFGKGTPAVRTQLCLAMAALAAHLPAAQWSEGGVLRWLMERFNGQDPEIAMSCMLELLTVLPQVGCNIMDQSSAQEQQVDSAATMMEKAMNNQQQAADAASAGRSCGARLQRRSARTVQQLKRTVLQQHVEAKSCLSGRVQPRNCCLLMAASAANW